MREILLFFCAILFGSIMSAQNQLAIGDQFVIEDLTYQITANNSVGVIACDTSAVVVNIPESVSYEDVTYNVVLIGDEAFQYRVNLTSVTIPNGVVHVGSDAFYCCINLSSVSFPDGLLRIGDRAFCRCGSLDSISIPHGVAYIGDYAFAGTSYSFLNGNPRFTSIVIPNTVSYLGKGAFSYCTNLEQVVFEENSLITSFAFDNVSEQSGVFAGCVGLTSINLPQNLLNLGDYTFFGCESLTTIDIPQNVSYIGKYVFYNCDKLLKVYLPDSATIDSTAFYNVGAKVIDGLTYSADLQLNVGGNCLEHLGGFATFYLQGEPYMEIPEEIAVVDCIDNKSGEVVILDDIEHEGVCYPVTAIGTTGFNSPFANCGSISSLVIGDNITYIKEGMFNDCSVLRSLVIGKHVTAINTEAFYFCENLTSVKTLATTPPTLGQNVFPFAVDTLIVPCGTMDSYMATNWNYYWDPVFNSVIIEETAINETITATINDGEYYTDNGFNVNEAGTYTQTFTAENGCDSIVTLHLYVNVSCEDLQNTEELTFYPNPTTDKLFFNQIIEEIEAVNQQGIIVLCSQNTSSVNLETLPAGVYYVRMINKGKAILRKVIKN